MELDLLTRLAAPIVEPLRTALTVAALPESIRKALGALLDGLVFLPPAVAVAALSTLAVRAASSATPRGNAGYLAIALASGCVAMALGVWLWTHPSPAFDGLMFRPDHLAFAGFAGLAFASLAREQRKWALTAVSMAVLLTYAGPLAVAITAAMTAVAIGLLHTPLRSRRRLSIAAQVAVVVGVYGIAFWLRHADFYSSWRLQGLLAIWSLRHISLVVSAMRSGPPRPADCAAFVSFYPGLMGLMGAPEVYDEFARRNLVRPAPPSQWMAVRHLVEGQGLLILAALLPVTIERVETSATVLGAWAFTILLFVKTALGVMGFWRVVDSAALFYGVRMRMNFTGLLTCRNPSELWWSWRGTFTNWLVTHVYAPLGANRRHQSFNIVAAFAVSYAWHAVGVPFLTPDFRWVYLAPVTLWAAINTAAVLAQVNGTRLGLLRPPAVIPAPLRIAMATLLTWALGSFNPILLAYQGPAVERLPGLLRLLLGLGPP